MSQLEKYDVVILGSGAFGKLLSWSLASQGKKTAVVERRYIGGSCPNIACLPSKNVVHSAKVANEFARHTEFGMAVEGWKVDMAGVRERKRKMVDGLVAMHQQKYKESGAELVMGQGRFVAPKTIEVALNGGGTRTLEGAMAIINTGSGARIDNIPGLLDARPLTHIEALELGELPEHLVVLGGGYVGAELAQAFRRFGSRVTVIERNATLVHQEDPDVTAAIEELFRDEKIDVWTGTTVERVEGQSGKSVRLRTGRGTLEATHILVAGGRTPNTDGIGLEKTGVEVDERGHVKVNDRLETTANGIWAGGDCAGSPYFTHIAEDDFRVVLANLAGGNRTTVGRQVPFCLFTDPELARIGLNEREAQERGIRYRLAKLPMMAVLRARTLSETRGFLKALVEEQGERILGFTAVGPEAGELLPVVQLAMRVELPYTAITDLVVTHPTMAEGLVSLFSAVPAAR
ncbi:MAG TPA: FAD-dependent oxidoreductase [Planctomycetaceae bacterium]|nr:FAD-dependent oxidoreductase [Planctomycetaceae bacterium]